MRAPRIAVVLTQLGYGGAERQTYELLRRLAGSEWAPRLVICLSEQLEPYGPLIEALGYPLVVIPRRSSFDLGRLRRLGAELRAGRIELVHAVHLLASGYSWLARRAIAGRRMLPTVRGTVVRPGRLKSWTYRRMLRSCPVTLVNSRRGAAFLVERFGAPPNRLRVVPNGVDFSRLRAGAPGRLRAELGVDPELRLVGLVGKNRPVKNIPRFMEILRRLLAGGTPVAGVLIGHGLGEEARTQLAPDLPAERLHLLGPRDDVPALLADLDLLLLTSDSEGCPNVVIEALGSGVPVVAGNVGDVEAMITPSRTGEIIDPPSDTGAFVAATRQVLAERDAYHRQVLTDRSRLERQYSLDAMTRSTVELWQQVLEGAPESEAG
ncbi:MAG: glycosyltransferase [Acidobacteriota bacterium]|nr:glycosyltransferase [Acidobacteriota bacterium]MDQ7087505.1 glycosyltransferase [Acidobacteriota bacterium]